MRAATAEKAGVVVGASTPTITPITPTILGAQSPCQLLYQGYLHNTRYVDHFNLLVVSPGKGGEDRKIVYNNIKTIIKFI